MLGFNTFPVTHIDEMTRNRRGCCHNRAYQVSAPAASLATFEIAIRG